eukprot:COSAG01_NODE_1303_length_10815_cov_14.897938_3_plen_87_part_00
MLVLAVAVRTGCGCRCVLLIAGARTFAAATALGMSVPLPGFVVIGAIVGGVAATPSMQAKASRWMANSKRSRTFVSEDAAYAHMWP